MWLFFFCQFWSICNISIQVHGTLLYSCSLEVTASRCLRIEYCFLGTFAIFGRFLNLFLICGTDDSIHCVFILLRYWLTGYYQTFSTTCGDYSLIPFVWEIDFSVKSASSSSLHVPANFRLNIFFLSLVYFYMVLVNASNRRRVSILVKVRYNSVSRCDLSPQQCCCGRRKTPTAGFHLLLVVFGGEADSFPEV